MRRQSAFPFHVWLWNYEKTLTPKLIVTAGHAVEGKKQGYDNSKKDLSFPGVSSGITFPEITFDGQNALGRYGLQNNALIHYAFDNVGRTSSITGCGRRTTIPSILAEEYHHYYRVNLE
jgi:hypothetical protein